MYLLIPLFLILLIAPIQQSFTAEAQSSEALLCNELKRKLVIGTEGMKRQKITRDGYDTIMESSDYYFVDKQDIRFMERISPKRWKVKRKK